MEEEDPQQFDEEVLDAFGMDTEAGRMLRRMPGMRRPKPTISYPKVKTKPSTERPAFIPGGGKTEADPRKATRKMVDVNIPAVGKRKVITGHCYRHKQSLLTIGPRFCTDASLCAH